MRICVRRVRLIVRRRTDKLFRDGKSRDGIGRWLKRQPTKEFDKARTRVERSRIRFSRILLTSMSCPDRCTRAFLLSFRSTNRRNLIKGHDTPCKGRCTQKNWSASNFSKYISSYRIAQNCTTWRSKPSDRFLGTDQFHSTRHDWGKLRLVAG